MAITLFYAGIPIVGTIAIAYAIVCCIQEKRNGAKPMTPETDEFLSRLILQMAKIEMIILLFVIAAVMLLWRSAATMEPDTFTILCGGTYLIMWLDIVMMAYTFALTYQVKLSRDSDSGQQ